MLVSCKYCNGLHERSAICERRPKDSRRKENNDITRFRNSRQWKRKREEIKRRDKYLCQLCIRLYPYTVNQYTFTNIEVHHIEPLHNTWHRRLDSMNLISVCSMHHKQCDSNDINTGELLNIVQELEANYYTT